MITDLTSDLIPECYKLCIFDLDGTLIDSVLDIATSLNNVFVCHGYNKVPVDFVKSAIGIGAKNLVARSLAFVKGYETPLVSFKKYLQDIQFSSEVESILTEYRIEYENNCLVQTVVYNGILSLLTDLRNRNIKLAVCTNKPEGATLRILKAFNLLDLFEIIVCPETTGERKPSGKVIDFILLKTSIKNENAILIGDSTTDIATAKNGGISVLAVLGGYCDQTELIKAKPDYLV